MKQAKITAADGYRCAPEGHTVVTFPMGTVVTGQVAEWAILCGAGKAMFPQMETKVTAPTETKKRGRKK